MESNPRICNSAFRRVLTKIRDPDFPGSGPLLVVGKEHVYLSTSFISETSSVGRLGYTKGGPGKTRFFEGPMTPLYRGARIPT